MHRRVRSEYVFHIRIILTQKHSKCLFTPRELEILRLLARGDKIVEIAGALDISYKTVANTTSLLKQELGAKTHSDLIRIAVEIGMD
jgi:DNA-binding CsgD family transcriptional regulator